MSYSSGSSEYEGAMDDSIDAESFRGLNIGGSNRHRTTHGSCIWSATSPAASQASGERPASEHQLQSPFTTPTAPSREHDLANSAVCSDASSPAGMSLTSAQRSNHTMGDGNGVPLHRSASPNVLYLHAVGQLKSQSDSRSSVNGSLRRSAVGSRGSPLPQGMGSRARPSSIVSPPPTGLSFAKHDFHTEARSGLQRTKTATGGAQSPSARGEFQRSDSCCNPPAAVYQADCCTATPTPSENGVTGGYPCDGCWGGGCEHCCPWRSEQIKYIGRNFFDDGSGRAHEDHHSAVQSQRAISLNQDDGEFATPDAARNLDTMPRQPAAFSLSNASNTLSSDHLLPEQRQNDPHTPAHPRRHRDVQQTGASEANAFNRPLSLRTSAAKPAQQSDIESRLGTLERDVASRIEVLGTKLDLLRVGHNGATGLNNIASIVDGGTHGSGINSTDLILRDLNKEVLEMSLYRKFKREQKLNDRLARIEGMLQEESGQIGEAKIAHAPATPPHSHELADLRHYLAQQWREIDALRADLGVLPQVQAAFVDLRSEARYTNERVTGLENMAYDSQQGAYGAARGTVNEHRAISTRVPQAATAQWGGKFESMSQGNDSKTLQAMNVDARDQGDWSPNPFAARSHGAPQSLDGAGWGAALGQSLDMRDSSSPAAGAGWGHSRQKLCAGNSGWDRGSPTTARSDSMPPSPRLDGWGTGSQLNGQMEGFNWSGDFDAASSHGRSDSQSELVITRAPNGRSDWSRVPIVSSWARASRLSGVSETRSSEVGSRTPTVKTIFDEEDEEWQPLSRRAQKSSSAGSWDVVSSQRRTPSHTSASQVSRRPSSKAEYWTAIGAEETSRAQRPVGGMTPPIHTHNGFGDNVPAPSSGWSEDDRKGGWLGEVHSRRASSKQSYDHWRRPGTPSKWEGQTGWGSGGANAGGE